MFKFIKLISVFSVLVVVALACNEVKEGVDKVSGQVTGKNQLEQKKKVEDKIKILTDQANKQQQDALDAISGK
ncbi:MAG: hypothetical protein HRT88_01770 [Lentisphaeraceae bacterium]|nr:hypothetical protein [Lentisphaeraceae bacterium]